MPTHFVNKVLLDFSFPSKEKDNALKTTKDLFYERLMPHISSGLDAVEGTVRIDRLEIDLGKTTIEDFENDFIKAFNQALPDHLQAPGTATAKALQQPTPFKDQQPQQATSSTSDAFFYFLQKGYWPWNFQQHEEKELTAYAARQLESAHFFPDLLRSFTRDGAHIIKRLLYFVAANPALVKTLVAALKKFHPGFKLVAPSMPAGWEKKAFKEDHFYFLFLSQLLVSPTLIDAESIFKLAKEQANIFYASPPANIKTFLNAGKTNSPNDTIESLKNFFLLIEEAAVKKQPAESTQPAQAINEQESNEATIHAAAINEAAQYNEPYVEAGIEKIAILNAGLVLFYPFLPAVFYDLGWTGGDKKFKDGNTQRKAVLFLQYLVNEKSRQPEHQLVLNKILCGWPVHLPLPAQANFSAKEKEAATDLIESLKEYWPVMKTTSNRGLVDSFVSRPGLVQRAEKGFILQVERKSIDILLDSLPLNPDMIKLPWNEQIIYTEW